MTRTNTMYSLGRWCLLFATMMTVAFAAPSFAKNFYAQMLDANNLPTTLLPNGTGVTIKLKVYNTSTEPATINSLVLCNIPGVTLTGVVANTGSGVLGNYVPGSEGDICLGTGGKTLTGFDGFKRLTNKTFQIVANVDAICSGSLATWPIFASTGNVFSGTTKFTNVQPTQYGCDVALSCSPPGSYTESSVPVGTTTTITRIEKSGFPCDPKSFNVLFSNGNNTVEIQWVGLGVVLRTEIDWLPTLVNAQTTQAPRTWVAWEQGVNGPKYIPVPTCKIDQPATPVVVDDLFPVLNNAQMPDPAGSYSFVPNPYVGQRTKICATEETYSVLGPSDPEFASCPVQTVLGCVLRHSILYASDDIFISNN